MLVHIIRLVSHNREITLKEAVLDARAAMEILFAGRQYLPAFLQRMDQAVSLSETAMDDLTAIHALGRGWCGDEALAIAVYSALKYSGDFEQAIIASVNHRGTATPPAPSPETFSAPIWGCPESRENIWSIWNCKTRF